MQIDGASDYLYMHIQTISPATLAILVFQINVANGKNWIAIDFDNSEQTDRASGYLYMHMQTISLAALDSLVPLQWTLPDPLLGCNIPGYFLT